MLKKYEINFDKKLKVNAYSISHKFKETQVETDEPTEITVFLPNFEKINISIESYEQTGDLLDVCID